jgi:hypothetical protein
MVHINRQERGVKADRILILPGSSGRMSSMVRRLSILLVALLLPIPALASAYRQSGSHTNPAPIQAILSNDVVSLTLDDVEVEDVTRMLSRITAITDKGLSFKCSPSAGSRRITINLTDVSPMAVIEYVCGQVNLFWRIDKDCVYLYTKVDENTARLSMQREGAWYELGESPLTIRLALSTNDDYRNSRYYQGREPLATDKLPAGVIASNTVVFEFDYRVGKVRPIYAEKLVNGKEKYLLLWADFDADGQYSTDESVTVPGERGDAYYKPEPFNRIVCDAGHRHSVPFSMGHSWAHVSKVPGRTGLCIEPQVAFIGILENAGIEVNVTLQDTDADGLVAELHDGRKAADFDSKLVLSVEAETNMSIWCPVAKMMAIGTNYYGVGVTIEGGISNPVAVLSLVPTNPPLSKVLIKGKNVASVLLTGPDAALKLTPQDGNLLVPCGSWRVQELTVVEGDTRFVFSTESYRSRALRLVVGQDCDNVLNAGGPLKHGVQMDGTFFGGETMPRLEPSLGVGGETYDIFRGSNRASPAWLITDSKGRKIASGEFEFG